MRNKISIRDKIDIGVELFINSLTGIGSIATTINSAIINEQEIAYLGVAGILAATIYSVVNAKGILSKRDESEIQNQFKSALINTLRHINDKQNQDSYIKLTAYTNEIVKQMLDNREITNEMPLGNVFDIISNTLNQIGRVENTGSTRKDYKKILDDFKLEFFEQLAIDGVNCAVLYALLDIDKVKIDVKTSKIKINELQSRVRKIEYISENQSRKISLPNMIVGIRELVGRESDIIRLDKLFMEKRPVVLVQSMGGVGKTELSKYYCENYQSNVGWFDFDITLKNTLMKLGDNSFEDEDDEYNRIKNYLLNIDTDTILVFDNVYKLEQEDLDFLCSLKCKVLITTRDEYPSHKHILLCHNLDMLTNAKCKELFYYYLDKKKESIKHEDPNLLEKIIELSSRHTLTIELLAKTYDNSFEIDMQRLLNLLHEKGFDIKNKVYRNGNVKEEEFIRHMTILFDISGINDKKKIHILKNLCILPPISVQGLKIINWLDINDEKTLIDLAQTGWLKSSEGYILMHPVICETLKIKLDPKVSDCEMLICSLSNELDFDDEDLRRYQPIYFPQCIAVADHFFDYTKYEVLEFLHHNIGYSFYNMGRFEDALKYYGKEKEICDDLLKKNNPDIATCYDSMGVIYDEIGEYKKAMGLYEKALEIRKKKLGKNHEYTALTYNNLGLLYRNTSEYKKSKKHFLKALEIRQKLFGKKDIKTARSYNDIGLLYDDMGKYDNAIKMYKKALKINIVKFGEKHPETATINNNIALTYHNMGKYDNACDLYNKSLKVREEVLGEEHVLTVTSYLSIGVLCEDKGELDEALKYYYRGLKASNRAMKGKTVQTIACYNNLGIAYNKKGNHEKSLEYHRKALSLNKKILGEYHPYTAASNNNIGLVYYYLEENIKAKLYIEKALNIQMKILEKDHPSIATTYNNLGLVYDNMCKYDIAIKYYKKALKIRIEKLGKFHLDTATSYYNIAITYSSIEDYDNALETIYKSYIVRLKILGKNNIDTINSLEELNNIYTISGKSKNDVKKITKKIQELVNTN